MTRPILPTRWPAWPRSLTAASPSHGGDPQASYVARLLHKGPDAFFKKIGEEATEVVMAAKDVDHGGDRQKLVARWPTCGSIAWWRWRTTGLRPRT
jgi:hypothetical protein